MYFANLLKKYIPNVIQTLNSFTKEISLLIFSKCNVKLTGTITRTFESKSFDCLHFLSVNDMPIGKKLDKFNSKEKQSPYVHKFSS